MKLITDIIQKPSQALQAMVDGLLEQDAADGREVYMNHWARSSEGICYGCAAICTIQKLTGNTLPLDHAISLAYMRAKHFDLEFDSSNEFEDAIDSARSGEMWPLFQYFGFHQVNANPYKESFHLGNNTWKDELPQVREVIAEMIANGH